MSDFNNLLSSSALSKNPMGVILAGGKSSRMGTDKALLTWQGKPFIQHVAQVLQHVFTQVVISSDRVSAYSFLNLPVIPDTYKECGPVGGIHSALVHTSADGVFVCSCDMPYLSVEVVKKILQHITLQEVTFGSDGERLHPLLGIYPKWILPTIQAELDQGSRRVLSFISKVPHSIVDVSEFKHQLRNINTTQDSDQQAMLP